MAALRKLIYAYEQDQRTRMLLYDRSLRSTFYLYIIKSQFNVLGPKISIYQYSDIIMMLTHAYTEKNQSTGE